MVEKGFVVCYCASNAAQRYGKNRKYANKNKEDQGLCHGVVGFLSA